MSRIGRAGTGFVAVLATSLALLTGCAGSGQTPAVPRSATSSGVSASPTAAAADGSTHSSPYVRVARGTHPDVEIRKNFGPWRWGGPWPLDLSGVRLTNGASWLVVQLRFSRLSLEKVGQVRGYGVGDTMSVFLDGNADGRAEAQIYVNWGYGGSIGPPPDKDADEIHRCPFRPALDRAHLTVTFRMPRSCAPHLAGMRAQADFASERLVGQVAWEAQDITGWTPVAAPGRTVSRSDPAR
jgi:hypothetical protein